MQINEAKEFIHTLDPKSLALSARRNDRKYPLRWIEHREGGGVIIDSAEINFNNFSDEDVIKFAKEEKIKIEMFTKYKDKTLDMILSIFGKPLN